MPKENRVTLLDYIDIFLNAKSAFGLAIFHIFKMKQSKKKKKRFLKGFWRQ